MRRLIPESCLLPCYLNHRTCDGKAKLAFRNHEKCTYTILGCDIGAIVPGVRMVLRGYRVKAR
jgi:hypothetical protein